MLLIGFPALQYYAHKRHFYLNLYFFYIVQTSFYINIICFLELFTSKPNIQNSIRIYEPPCTEPTKHTSLSMSISKTYFYVLYITKEN